MATIETVSASTGKAAQIAGVEVRTIKKLFDQGQIKGVRMPSGHRRIHIPSLIRFLSGEAGEK